MWRIMVNKQSDKPGCVGTEIQVEKSKLPYGLNGPLLRERSLG